MSTSTRWMLGTVLGLAAWIGAMVAVAMTNPNPSDPLPIVLTFVVGAAVFFGAVFGIALWQTRTKPSAELDALLASLTLTGQVPPTVERAYHGGRLTVRSYLWLGITVTALGLASIVLGLLDIDFTRVTIALLVGIVVVWALAVPFVLRNRRGDAAALFGPLGLVEHNGTLSGIRYGREISIRFTPRGSVTWVKSEWSGTLDATAIAALEAGAAPPGAWRGVSVRSDGEYIVVKRVGHPDHGWLRDLRLGETLAGGASG